MPASQTNTSNTKINASVNRLAHSLANMGICKIEARWFSGVLGTKYMKHPVAQRRVKNILEQVKAGFVSQKKVFQTGSQLRHFR